MIQSIHINNFRNISNIKLECNDCIQIFLGENGQGKTNILEAIYSLSIGKPFRSKTTYEAIKFDEEVFHITAKTESQELEIHSANSPRKQTKYVVNNENKSFFNFLGNYYAVLFSPEDLELIRGTPGVRRNYLDSILIRLDKQYAHELSRYEKTVKHRNALLKKINEGVSSRDELDIWDAELDKHGAILWEKRLDLIEVISDILKTKYYKISNKEEPLSLEYLPKRDSDNFIQDLKDRREKDIIIGSTTVGPHRDNFRVFLRDKDASEFASQGETRSLVLAFKFSEVKLLEKKHSSKVTLLLDDVFSELDKDRQTALMELSKGRQTFISCTHIDEHLKFECTNIIEVKKGSI